MGLLVWRRAIGLGDSANLALVICFLVYFRFQCFRNFCLAKHPVLSPVDIIFESEMAKGKGHDKPLPWEKRAVQPLCKSLLQIRTQRETI